MSKSKIAQFNLGDILLATTSRNGLTEGQPYEVVAMRQVLTVHGRFVEYDVADLFDDAVKFECREDWLRPVTQADLDALENA